MKYQVKSLSTGGVITESDLGVLEALRGVEDLRNASLYRTNLTDADLTGVNLTDTDLFEANLTHAQGINRYLSTPLLFLLDQPSKIRAYKLVGPSLASHFRKTSPITYEIGKTHSVEWWDSDETEDCGAGINLATMDWCLQAWERGCRVLIAEFTAQDIVAIPISTSGKLRVKRCQIVGEVDLRKIVPEWFRDESEISVNSQK